MRITYEKIVPGAGRSFALLDKRAAVFDGHYHFHPEYEVTLIESSAGHRVVGDSIEPFVPGDLVLLGPNLPHQYVSDPAKTGSKAIAKVIQFKRDFAGAAFLDMPEARKIVSLLERSEGGLRFGASTVAAAHMIIGRLFAGSGFDQVIHLLELLHTLSTDREAEPIASAGYTPRISSRESVLVDRALQYLNHHFSESVTFVDLCRHLKLAPATCNRLFRKSLGRSFKSMLNEIRISYACRLLIETDQQVVEVAYASGFPNLSNFNRRFKQLKSVAPRTYRSLTRHSENGT